MGYSGLAQIIPGFKFKMDWGVIWVVTPVQPDIRFHEYVLPNMNTDNIMFSNQIPNTDHPFTLNNSISICFTQLGFVQTISLNVVLLHWEPLPDWPFSFGLAEASWRIL